MLRTFKNVNTIKSYIKLPEGIFFAAPMAMAFIILFLYSALNKYNLIFIYNYHHHTITQNFSFFFVAFPLKSLILCTNHNKNGIQQILNKQTNFIPKYQHHKLNINTFLNLSQTLGNCPVLLFCFFFFGGVFMI